jgi:hypothetical protein
MKKIIYAATVALTCISAISVGLASPSITSKAVAAEGSCIFLSGSNTTGGSVRTQLDANANCNATNQPTTMAKPSIQPRVTMSSIQLVPNVVRSSNRDNGYPAYCTPLAAGVTPGDFAFREALEQCKYGL